ncbi:hypothetical protein HPB51_023140 [Rhipicephalus microplus]|uniref:Alpha-tubulin suppressor n=1 Tax=Rhipicephalus microplus TaxID=6941 RepID=A0A9J6DK24_RHIMP|nr:hypothetical protein HPB51_023140 [Rhipicephalus microplus]
MTADEEEDIPGSGAVCTFGKTRFAGNMPGMFWVKNDPVIHVACGDEHSVFITAGGRVFSFGSNEYGQLGHGHKNTVVRPKCVKALKDQRAVLLACGRAHTLVATDDHRVYGFGVNTEHQLGLNSQEFQHPEPALITALTGLQIKQLAAGAEHSVALTDKGTAYVWGGGKEGQLGLGTKATVPSPLELKVDIRIMCVSTGYYHTAIVSVDGILYTFGERDGGKLGLPKTLCCKRYNKPTEVSTIPGKIVSVSCGGTHTMALTAEGKVYAFGDGRNGQLGLGNKTLQSNKPQLIPFVEGIKIAKVVCGESHTAFLSDKRQLMTCGDARHGKLALVTNDASANQFTPALVEELLSYQVQQVACGGCHTLVLVIPGSGQEVNANNEIGATGDVNGARAKRRHRKAALIENEQDEPDACEEDSHVTARVLSETSRQPRKAPLLVEAATDTSIRHVDSDVSDDDTSEMSVLNKDSAKSPQGALQNGDKAKLNGPKEEKPAVPVPETPKKTVSLAGQPKTDSESEERRDKVRWLPAHKDSPKHRKELERMAEKAAEKSSEDCSDKGTPTKRGKKKKDAEGDKEASKESNDPCWELDVHEIQN